MQGTLLFEALICENGVLRGSLVLFALVVMIVVVKGRLLEMALNFAQETRRDMLGLLP